MGKLKAFKLGIVKGVQHTFQSTKDKVDFANAINFTVSRMKCTTCGHASRAHTDRRSLYVGMDGEDIFKLLKATFNQTIPGFDECMVYNCSQCEYLACEGHHDKDSCNGEHDKIQDSIHQSEKRSEKW